MSTGTITGHFVDGEMIAGAVSDAIEVVNPSTGEVIGHAAEASSHVVDHAVRAASRAGRDWATTAVAERAEYLTKWGEKLAAEADALVDLTVDELGLPPAVARNTQVNRAIDSLKHLPEMAETILGQQREVGNSLVVREPAGVVAAITAWNFPLNMLVSKLASAVIMGNTVVVKPSEIKPLAAWRAVELLAELEFPRGVVNVVGGRGPTVGAALVDQTAVDVISFTGSRDVGKAIVAVSSRTLTRCVLELGGKNAAVILPSADLDEALPAVIASCFFNNGQVCGAQTRLVVERSRLAEVEERIASIVGAVVTGPARASGITLGPVVSAAQHRRVSEFIAYGEQSGLRVVAGGSGRPAGVPDAGFFVRPTVFSEVPPDHRLANEEIFGPVLVIQVCDGVEEMIELANATRYGLTASVWAGDVDEAIRVARRIQAGQVVVNGGPFNLHAPIGGFKESGIGREHGLEGLAELSEVKSIHRPLTQNTK
ncbi:MULTISPECIES: aldehyde dehydrogenase family protein [Gordonia]|uniref:aldehyde dehydrogenase (NAD(+)) n=1 Tax=Gordonia alkanivorans NBRC 16433 TaxID=1027371 RepID=F9VRX6_9ACTN|nr:MULTISPECIES: aldehyde dehydrogenase family protein [Gordonia]MDH3020530.1 aldehyde dehydrogenase family protein [Gordonia alkanivorans]MDH3049391.1 aldehyde dehydrogenase family protein [Gordonia alkanivorans]MDJ0007296.1 aldehyde dehydrogenase family protein [Gordonia alkanivorans]MDJ0027687.1 aldehyde dehydrogenase family protein [Gordonia alkanivorans]MDJ0098391.1 aldehyde dehydrogenase family protein [Gordonia alkanivorans]